MKSTELPQHLRKYVVDQESRHYTPVDHAVWRFALRQLRSYLSVNAHDSYLSGLQKTGIEVERIPRIQDISDKLSKFGWRALPVSGFIPPAAFMELQALSVLPIASDIRSVDHLLYTPAPDIVHEAAGHAPMIANPEFADYLRRYAKVASKAIISKEDMDLYAAIRDLSDIKENPQSTADEVKAAEEKLAQVSSSMSHVSEATWLSRMNWWTAEYGLIGSLEKPKIYGAGLLSSVGESRLCLSSKVKKIPLTIDCIEMTYDITEPQPQLFVAPDFPALNRVLDQLAERMAFQIGGLKSVERAIQAQTVNTVELNSGLQISGKCVEAIRGNKEPIAYLRFEGPCQLAFLDKEMPGHGGIYHRHGFGTPIGFLKSHPRKCPSLLTDAQWDELGAKPGGHVRLEYESGCVVTGDFAGRLQAGRHSVLLSLTNARAELNGRVLFEPEWGTFDVAIGSSIPTVFGGPADRVAYGETDDFVARRVPEPKFSEADLRRHTAYAEVRALREQQTSGADLITALRRLLTGVGKEFAEDWLLQMEMYEMALNRGDDPGLTHELKSRIDALARKRPDQSEVILDGLALAHRLV